MRIAAFDIKGFGRLNQLKIAPAPGFNIIYEPNESGKSTLQAFLRAMLYGLKGGRKGKDGSASPLKRYKPWNGEQYAGILEYILDNGEFYRIGRNFEKGTVNICDSSANNLNMRFQQDRESGPKFAEEHLGIDEATFEKSAFIRQLMTTLNEDGRKSLVEKISNLNTAGSEEISITKALNALETTLLERVGTGRSTTRPLDQINIKLDELETRQRSLMAINEQYLDTARELHEKKGNLAELEEQLGRLKKQKEELIKARLSSIRQELAGLGEAACTLEDELTACRNSLYSLRLYEGIPEDTSSKAAMLIRDIEQYQAALTAETTRLEKLRDSNADIGRSLDEEDVFLKKVKAVEIVLKTNNQEKAPAEKTRNKRAVGLIIVLSIILLISMIYLYSVTQSVAFLAVGCADLIAICVYLLTLPGGLKGSHLRTNTDRISEVLTGQGFKDWSDFLEYKETQSRKRSLLEYNAKQTAEIENHISELRIKITECSSELTGILKITGKEYQENNANEGAEELKKGIVNLRRLKDNLRLLLSKKSGISDQIAAKLKEAEAISGKVFNSIDEIDNAVGTAVSDYESSSIITHRQVFEEITALQERIKDIQIDLAKLTARMEKIPPEGELSAVIEEISLLNEKKKALEKAGSSLALAGSVIKEVALKHQKDYIPVLNEEMSNIVRCLTSGRYSRVCTNDDFQVNLEVPETDELVSVNSLSAGTVDQVYLAMRIASIRLIEGEKERLPLFLDEIFSQYDESRLEKAFELLEQLSLERQIFFFTCKEREYILAQSFFGDRMNRIKL